MATIVGYRPTQYYIPAGYYHQNGSNTSHAPKILVYIVLCFFFIVFFIILWCAGCCMRRPNRCHRNITSSTSVTTSTTSTNNNTTSTSTTTSSSNVVIIEIDVKRVVESIPVFVYSEKIMEKLECVICLCEFKDGQQGRRLPKCNHKFHLSCIDKWLFSHSTCPICRTNPAAASSSSVPPV